MTKKRPFSIFEPILHESLQIRYSVGYWTYIFVSEMKTVGTVLLGVAVLVISATVNVQVIFSTSNT